MITGKVNHEFEPVVSLNFYSADGEMVTFPGVVDTGFDGEICMPLAEIKRLNLPLLPMLPIRMKTANEQIVNSLPIQAYLIGRVFLARLSSFVSVKRYCLA